MQWGFPKDEFVDHRHRPHAIYVRQGRRIWGEYNFTERDADPDRATGLPKRKPDGIAVAEYPFDCHGVSNFDPAHPFLRPGYFYVEHDPLATPLSHRRAEARGWSARAGRMQRESCRLSDHPHGAGFMALGEACGIAAKIAQDAKAEVRAVNVPDVQREILKRGGVILYENAPLKPDGL